MAEIVIQASRLLPLGTNVSGLVDNPGFLRSLRGIMRNSIRHHAARTPTLRCPPSLQSTLLPQRVTCLCLAPRDRVACPRAVVQALGAQSLPISGLGFSLRNRKNHEIQPSHFVGRINALPESNLDDDDNHDDSDVPLISVVRDALGNRLNAPSTTLPVSTAARESESEGMSAINDEEDIWAFDDQGQKWADIGALKDDKVADGAEEEEA
ncbi:hypothetical protein B0H13DRAFT_1908964 [Mycena leptocephala]|nr:hypothetical protein B0H13DRAFT_1908964 [Mycena leptocephala]